MSRAPGMSRAPALTWTRVARQGFIASHWVGKDSDGRARFKIEQRKEPGRMNRGKYALLFFLPAGLGRQCDNVQSAKRYAQGLARDGYTTP